MHHRSPSPSSTVSDIRCSSLICTVQCTPVGVHHESPTPVTK
ncbi:hypothetical protein Hanom_Chr12g01097281 [Helianthus anomalus]